MELRRECEQRGVAVNTDEASLTRYHSPPVVWLLTALWLRGWGPPLKCIQKDPSHTSLHSGQVQQPLSSQGMCLVGISSQSTVSGSLSHCEVTYRKSPASHFPLARSSALSLGQSNLCPNPICVGLSPGTLPSILVRVQSGDINPSKV